MLRHRLSKFLSILALLAGIFLSDYSIGATKSNFEVFGDLHATCLRPVISNRPLCRIGTLLNAGNTVNAIDNLRAAPISRFELGLLNLQTHASLIVAQMVVDGDLKNSFSAASVTWSEKKQTIDVYVALSDPKLSTNETNCFELAKQFESRFWGGNTGIVGSELGRAQEMAAFFDFRSLEAITGSNPDVQDRQGIELLRALRFHLTQIAPDRSSSARCDLKAD